MPDLPPLYADLTFLSPLSHERAASLVQFVSGSYPGTVLDIGCGWGELLLRSVEAAPEATGLGIDLEADFLEEARRRAEQRGLAGRVSFEARDARSVEGAFDAVLCVGAAHVWGEPVEAAQPLSYGPALAALRGLLRPGGKLVFGDAIWTKTPTVAATSALGGRDDEYLSVDALVSLTKESGFAVAGVDVATQDEWDDFEAGFVGRLERWLESHPTDHADALGVREQLQDQRDRYLDGYRGVLGMAYVTLIAS